MMTVVKWDRANEDAQATSAVFRLLADIWLKEPDEGMLSKLADSEFAQAYQAAGGDLTELAEATPESEIAERLACDYCQLFIGPRKPLSLHQSVWSEGRLEGAAVRGVREFADVLGLSLDELESSMPDHLSVELGIMATILDRYQLAEDDSDERSALGEIAQSFFARHLTWPGPLFRQAHQRSETSFYRGLIRLTDDFLRAESATMLSEPEA